eukprot:scaffold212368_cov17-Prasinocladus_malaysianus.AAC.1
MVRAILGKERAYEYSYEFESELISADSAVQYARGIICKFALKPRFHNHDIKRQPSSYRTNKIVR